jgi:hypothetical protein
MKLFVGIGPFDLVIGDAAAPPAPGQVVRLGVGKGEIALADDFPRDEAALEGGLIVLAGLIGLVGESARLSAPSGMPVSLPPLL